jgi:hypothetical protein
MDSRLPMVAGWGFVASGFGLTTGASDGCGGGVARWRSSFRTYRPVWFLLSAPCSTQIRGNAFKVLTLADQELVLRPLGVREHIVGLDHGDDMAGEGGGIVRGLVWVPRGRR